MTRDSRRGRTRGASAVALLLAASALAAQADVTTTVIAVRHADKGARPAEDPQLSRAGEARARLLASMLQRAGVSAIYSSEARRTRSTAQPVSDRTGVPVRVRDASATLVELTSEYLLREHPGGVVVVVTHSNLLPDLVRGLTGIAVGSVSDGDYSNLFVIQLREGSAASLLHLRYGEE